VDRRTLIRRLYFDLIGLPPTPEQVAEFTANDDPKAYEQLVDRWLDSLHFGERWARHWLELAHYADPHGFERGKLRDNTWHRMKKAMIGDHIEALRNATGLPRGSLRLLLNKEGNTDIPHFRFLSRPRR
jgi:hypothetical protein